MRGIHSSPVKTFLLSMAICVIGVTSEGRDGASLTEQAAEPHGTDWQKWITLICDIKNKQTTKLLY